MTVEFTTRHRKRSRIPAEPGRPYFVEKGMGDRAHLFTDLFTVYAGGEQTENTFDFLTAEGPEGDLVPTHSHRETHEVFHVTDGAVRLFVEDLEGEQHEKLLTAGDFGVVPKNCPHAYRIERHHSRIVGVAAGPGGHLRALLREPRRPHRGARPAATAPRVRAARVRRRPAPVRRAVPARPPVAHGELTAGALGGHPARAARRPEAGVGAGHRRC